MPMLLMSDTRLFVIEALDQGQRVVGRCVLRAFDRDQAARWAPRLLCWQVGTITLAEAGWSRTRVRVADRERTRKGRDAA
jgi:hypothetical protein